MDQAREYQLTARFEVDEDGVVIAECLELQGCHAHGSTREEARANLREAVVLYLQVLADRGEEVPKLDTETFDVAV